MEKLTCFVIMPFSEISFFKEGKEVIVTNEEWTYIFDEWIKKAVESYETPIICKRSPLAPGNFIKGIVKDISSSDITIADLTGGKPNVYYELGIRHSSKNGTIIISQNFKDLPSDLNSYYCFEYNYSSEAFKYRSSFKKFEKNIHQHIKHILNNNYPSDNPVSDYLEKENLKHGILESLDETKMFGKEKLLLHTVDRITVIPDEEISFLQADRAYCHVYLENGDKHLISDSLTVVSDKLDNRKFFRVHRSYVVNSNMITHINKADYFLTLKSGITIPMSRSFMARYKL